MLRFNKTQIIHLSYFCRYHAKGNCSSDCSEALDHRHIDDSKLQEIVEWCETVLPKAGKVKIGGVGDQSVINRCYAKDKFRKYYRRIPQLQKNAKRPVPESSFGNVHMCLGEFHFYTNAVRNEFRSSSFIFAFRRISHQWPMQRTM